MNSFKMVGQYPTLTPAQRAFVRDIEIRKKAALAAFPTRKQLAEQLGCKLEAIHAAASGREYKHDRVPQQKRVPRGTPNHLTEVSRHEQS